MWDMLDLGEGSGHGVAANPPLGSPTPALPIPEKGALSQLDSILHQLSAGFNRADAHRQQREPGVSMTMVRSLQSVTIPDAALASPRAGQHSVGWDSREEHGQSPTPPTWRPVPGVKAESEHSDLTALTGLHARLSASLPASPVCASALEAAVRGSRSATITQVLARRPARERFWSSSPRYAGALTSIACRSDITYAAGPLALGFLVACQLPDRHAATSEPRQEDLLQSLSGAKSEHSTPRSTPPPASQKKAQLSGRGGCAKRGAASESKADKVARARARNARNQQLHRQRQKVLPLRQPPHVHMLPPRNPPDHACMHGTAECSFCRAAGRLSREPHDDGLFLSHIESASARQLHGRPALISSSGPRMQDRIETLEAQCEELRAHVSTLVQQNARLRSSSSIRAPAMLPDDCAEAQQQQQQQQEAAGASQEPASEAPMTAPLPAPARLPEFGDEAGSPTAAATFEAFAALFSRISGGERAAGSLQSNVACQSMSLQTCPATACTDVSTHGRRQVRAR